MVFLCSFWGPSWALRQWIYYLFIKNLNVQLKYLLKEPRPYWYLGVQVVDDLCGTDYGFPSGQCEVLVAFYVYWTLKVMKWRKRQAFERGASEYSYWGDWLIVIIWTAILIFGVLLAVCKAFLAQNFLYFGLLSYVTGFVILSIFMYLDDILLELNNRI